MDKNVKVEHEAIEQNSEIKMIWQLFSVIVKECQKLWDDWTLLAQISKNYIKRLWKLETMLISPTYVDENRAHWVM